ncbi:unnamed protein product [Camellia sinensis]
MPRLQETIRSHQVQEEKNQPQSCNFKSLGKPMSCRVKTALKLKGIEHEFIEEDLANKSPLLVKYNPVHKKIHLPLHNGKPICESLVILECIDETWKGTPILPKDPREIAMARFWANFIDEKCFPAILKALSSKDDEQEKAMEEASEDLKTLKAQLNDKKLFWRDYQSSRHRDKLDQMFRVEIALKWKDIEYEFIQQDLQNKSPLLLKCNPIHKKIPVLLHNGKPICESLVILEYIDETWKGNPIFPEDPHERAIARFWANFIDEKCLPAINKACFTKDDKGIEETIELLKTLEAQLTDKKFFGGDSVGLVDIVATFIGYWLEVIQEVVGVELLTEEKFPRLYKWIEDYVNCCVIKEHLPPREKLLASAKTYFQQK